MQKILRSFTASLIISLNCFSISAIAQTDAGVYVVLDPVSGSTLVIGSSFPVTAQVVNYGTTTITSMQMKFSIGVNNVTLDEWWSDTLAAGDTLEYTFTEQFVLIDTTNGKDVYCLADPPGDTNPPNNDANPVYTYVSSNGLAGPEAEKLDKPAFDHFIVIPGQELLVGISTNDDGGDPDVSLLSIDGRTLLAQTAQAGSKEEVSFDISSLAQGMYLVVVRNKKGQLVQKLLL